MKIKNICRRIIPAAAVGALIFTVALLIIRPDFRFMAQTVLERIGGETVTEIDGDKLEVERIDIKDIENKSQSLMLVNGCHKLDGSFYPELGEYNGVTVNSAAVEDFGRLCADVKEKYGESLYVMSSYRTAEEQSEILDEQGSDTAQYVGASEHQTGLALDVYVQNYSGRAFLKSEAGRYVNEHCSDYGFIIRYPLLKSSVTKIDYEPWHLRYVGQPHAELISKGYVTLEEYYGALEYGKFYRYKNYIISRQKGETASVPAGCTVELSCDNCGGYILTCEMSGK